MIFSLIFLLAFSRADTSLREKAINEMPVQPRAAAPAQTGTPQLVLKILDDYQTPKMRSFDWSLKAQLESFKFSGLSPNHSLGKVNLKDLGSLPFFSLEIGVSRPINSKLSWGSHLSAGYSLSQYSLTTPTGVQLSPRVHALALGAGLTARFYFLSHFFTELGSDYSQMSIRQSSPQSSLAQWDQEAHTRSRRLALGTEFSNQWELSLGYRQRDILKTELNLESDHWIMSTGARW